MEPKISVQIIAYQSLRFLPFLLDSLRKQSFDNFSVLIIDNASSDNTFSYLRENYPKIPVLRNKVNLGYSKANNQGIRLSSSEYILVVNPDVILERDFLEKIVGEMTKNKRIGAAGGKLLKVRFRDPHTAKFPETTKIIDSCGIEITKSLRFLDRGEGEEDKGQYDRKEEVFGITGACVLYRRKALEDIAYGKEYFDEDFFAYKEDIDIAWRLKNKGWISFYNPEAVAYHFRGTGAYLDKKRFSSRYRAQLKKSHLVNFLSWRNHLWVILKNCPAKLFFYSFPYFFAFQISKSFWLFFTDPWALIYGFFSFFKGLGKMLIKRKGALS